MSINPVNVTSLSREAAECSQASQATDLDLATVHSLHADFVWAALQRLGIRDADLEDVHQEVFVVVHNKLGTFDGSAKMTTWLFAIALRVAAAYRRRAYVRREQLGHDPEVGDRTSGATDASDLSDANNAGMNPERAASDSEARAQLMSVLDRMGLERRAVFVMFEIEEMGCEEIAAIVGVPVGTIYSRLHTARAEFHKFCKQLRAAEGFGK